VDIFLRKLHSWVADGLLYPHSLLEFLSIVVVDYKISAFHGARLTPLRVS
jgi:hypothetical protein